MTPYPGTGHSLTLVESLTIGQLAQLAGAHDSAVGVVAAARAKLRALDERQKELDATRVRLARLIDLCADPGSEDCRALRVRG